MNGKTAKQMVKYLPWGVSGGVLLALWAAGSNKKLALLCVVLGLAAAEALPLFHSKRPAPALPQKGQGSATGCGVVLAALGGVQFYQNWQFQNLADRLGLPAWALVGALAVVAAVAAAPAAVALCRWLLAQNAPRCAAVLQSRALFWVLVALAAAMVAVQAYFAVASGYIWADEVFSLKLIRHPYAEVAALTAIDVHPPLYYFILKFTTGLLGFLPTIPLAKLVSLLPQVLLVGWAALAGRGQKAPGRLALGLFAVCAAGMPSLTDYSLEIRMYSWGLLFVTAGFVCGWRAAAAGERRAWVGTAVFGLCAAYTHYFACIAVALAYLALLVWCVWKNRPALKRWAALAAVTVVGYLPWLVVLLGQLRTVKGNYWIEPITAKTLPEYWQFAFGTGRLGWVVVLLAALLAAVCLAKRVQPVQGLFTAAALLTPVWVTLVGLAASALVRPVFIARYLLPALGCLWLGVAAAVALLGSPRAQALLAALLVAFALGNLRDFAVKEQYEAAEAASAYAILDTLPADAKLVATAVRVEEKLAGMTERDAYVWGDTLGDLPKSVYDNLYDLNDAATLTQWAQQGVAIYFFVNESAAGTAEEAAAQAGLQATQVAECSLGEPLTVWQLTAP